MYSVRRAVESRFFGGRDALLGFRDTMQLMGFVQHVKAMGELIAGINKTFSASRGY